MGKVAKGLLGCGLSLLGLVMLAGCEPARAPQSLLAGQCYRMDGTGELPLDLRPSSSGVLRVLIEQRGISLVASESGRSGAPTSSAVDRAGVVGFVRVVRAGEPVRLRIRSRDSREIGGRACVVADLLDPEDERRVRAEQAFAAAGRAAHARDWSGAYHRYRAAARGFDSLGATRRAAAARHAMAELAYGRLHRERESHALAVLALAQYGATATPEAQAGLLALRAKALLELPESPLADASRVAALLDAARRAYARSEFGAREIARLGVVRGYAAFASGDPQRAASLFAEAADACRLRNDRRCYAEARQNLGVLAEEDKNYTVALQAYADALHSLDRRRMPELAADIVDNLGRLEGSVGLLRRSEISRNTAVELYGQVRNCDGIRRSLARLGTLLVQAGSIGEAMTRLHQAVALSCAELLELSRDEVPAGAGARSASFLTSRSLPEDDPLAVRCTAPPDAPALSADGRLAVFLGLVSLSEAHLLNGDTDRAGTCLQMAQAFSSGPRNDVRLANVNGELSLQRRDAARARAWFDVAGRAADSAGLPPTQVQRGSTLLGLSRAALMAGEPAPAREHATRALWISAARADVAQLTDALHLLAASLAASREPQPAARVLQVAARLAEKVPIADLDGERRATYLASQHAVHADLVELLATQALAASAAPEGQALAWRALLASERGRSRSLRHALAQLLGESSTLRPASSRAEYGELLARITEIAQRRPGGGSWNALVTELGLLVPSGREDETALFDPARLAARLSALDATLVEYAVGQEHMWAFVLDHGVLRVTKLGATQAIDDAAAELGRRLRDPESAPRSIGESARRLARQVLWPLQLDRARGRTLFVPDGELHGIPFAALPWSAEPDSRLVLHHTESVTAPSALFLTVADALSAPPTDAPRIELIGDPVYRMAEWRRRCAPASESRGRPADAEGRAFEWTDRLPSLPGTRDEVLSIAALARAARPAVQVEVRLECAATPNALRRMEKLHPAVLHVATHGRIDAHRPRLSALVLTPDAADETPSPALGLLDVLDLRLQTDLVVLSACDSSNGRLLPGEGVLGPAQAFLQAGAASVLATYWRIEDRWTSAFVQRFYRHLLVEGLPAGAALRRAQLEEAAAGGYHWAAFGLHGRPDVSI